MTWNPDQHDDNAIVRYEGRPNEADCPAEETRWKRFLKFMHLNSRKTGELGETYARAEVTKKQNEAAKIGAEAAEIASQADLNRIKVVAAVNDEIQRIFSQENLSPAATTMQLRMLAKEHPEILERFKALEDLAEDLRLRKGVQFQIVQDEPTASESPPAKHA